MPGLAYIGKVAEIVSIEGAERVEAATVVCGRGGKWSGVVQRGQFTPGDFVEVYLQDALLPEEERFGFMANKKYRVRMMRFLGVPSECLIMPVKYGGEVGQDITDIARVSKYEKQIPPNMSGEIAGAFPPFVPKTDEPNFQSARHLVDALVGWPWVATQKADGTSGTAFNYNGRFGVCSRNWELRDGNNVYWLVARKYSLRELLPSGYAVQWETVGPGIQKNPLGLPAVDGLLFNVYYIHERRYVGHDEVRAWARYFSMPMVKEVRAGESFDLSDDELRELAEGTYQNGKQQEGIVIRPVTEQIVAGDRLSFKVINLLYKE